MIPKIIHYCWLSGEKFPPLIERCIESWKLNLPDYDFLLWNTQSFNLNDCIWVKQAFEKRKYAFAADYIRLFAVYKFGGIYLDSDIEVLKSFDDLLELPYFIGSEGNGIIEAGIFGAEQGNSWIEDCLKYYDGKKFIKEDGDIDTLTLPRIMMSVISKNREIIEIDKKSLLNLSHKDLDKNLFILPKDFFCSKNLETGEIERTINTYTIHHFAMSWIPRHKVVLSNIKKVLMRIFGVTAILFFIRSFRLRELREWLSR